MKIPLTLCFAIAVWGDNFLVTSNISKAHALYPTVFKQSVSTLERDELEYRTKIDELEIKKLKSQLKGLKLTINELSSTLKEKDIQNIAYENKLHELLKEFVTIKQAYETLPRDTTLLMGKVQELTKKNNELSIIGSLKNPAGYALYDMEQQLREIKKEYQVLQNDYRKLVMTTGALSQR